MLKQRMEEHCLLAYSLVHVQLPFLSKAHLHRGGIFHSRLGPPASIIDQEKCLTNMPAGHSDGCKSSLGSPPKYLNFAIKVNNHKV